MDLQLAYLAAPQNAAQVNSAQQAPAAAQAAAQTAFAEQVHKREETIAEVDHAQNPGIRTNPDGQGNAGGYEPDERPRREYHAPAESSPLGLADGEHFIDVTV